MTFRKDGTNRPRSELINFVIERDLIQRALHKSPSLSSTTLAIG